MDLSSIIDNTNIPVVSAFLLGLLTAISPCPLATNITAIAYVSRQVKHRKQAVITSGLYVLGRMFSYSLLGILMVVIGLEVPWVASTLQSISEIALGPILILIGLAMLFISKIPLKWGGGKLTSMGEKVASKGMFGGFLLGAIFALAFCPYSAVLFFGILIPLSLKSAGGIGLPAVYAIGTGLPVLIIGTIITASVASISTWLNAISRTERIIRVMVSIIFICVGIYYVVLSLKNPGI